MYAIKNVLKVCLLTVVVMTTPAALARFGVKDISRGSGHVVGQVQHGAGHVADQVQDGAGHVADQVQDGAGQAVNQTKQLVTNLTQSVTEAGGKISLYCKNTANQLKKKTSDVGDWFDEKVGSPDLLSGISSGLLGLLLIVLFPLAVLLVVVPIALVFLRMIVAVVWNYIRFLVRLTFGKSRT